MSEKLNLSPAGDPMIAHSKSIPCPQTASLSHALIVFLTIPGTVSIVIPMIWLWHTTRLTPFHPLALLCVIPGLSALIWCVHDFYVYGKGTLAPWRPPTVLVTSGLYRFSRNPMYLSVLLILIGWTLYSADRFLIGYTVTAALLFHLRVVFGEEPYLARAHGQSWKDYSDRVPRWFCVRSK